MEYNAKLDMVTAFKSRTIRFVLDSIKLYEALPKSEEAVMMGKKLIRSSSSVGSNYLAACKCNSAADFYSKLDLAERDADETAFWIWTLVNSGIVDEDQTKMLLNETSEIAKVIAEAKENF